MPKSREGVEDDEQQINKSKELVPENRRLTVRDFSDMDGISEGSVKTILIIWV